MMTKKKYLFLLTITPVQDFISQARKLKDLFGGSDILSKMAETGIKVLWGTANLFSNPRYMNGAATNPDFNVVAHAGAQVKNAIDATIALDGENYVFCISFP